MVALGVVCTVVVMAALLLGGLQDVCLAADGAAGAWGQTISATKLITRLLRLSRIQKIRALIQIYARFMKGGNLCARLIDL